VKLTISPIAPLRGRLRVKMRTTGPSRGTAGQPPATEVFSDKLAQPVSAIRRDFNGDPLEQASGDVCSGGICDSLSAKRALSSAAPAIALCPVEGPRVVGGDRKECRSARTRSKAQAKARSASSCMSGNSATANSSFFLTLLCAGAAGQWYYGAHGIRSRQKRDIRGHHVDRTLLSRNDVWKWKEVEDSKSGDHALGTGGSVGAKKLVSWF